MRLSPILDAFSFCFYLGGIRYKKQGTERKLKSFFYSCADMTFWLTFQGELYPGP